MMRDSSNANTIFRKSVFFKIFLSLLLLTLIPIFCLGLTSYFVFYRTMRSQSDEFDRLIVSAISERIDRDLEDVKEILFRYALFMDIEEENYGRLLRVVRELGGIAGTSDFIKDIFVYFVDSDQVLTQNGVYDADLFFDEVYRYVDRPGSELAGILREQNSFRVLGTTTVVQDGFQENRYVTILSSVPIRDKPKANLVVLVDEQHLRSILDSTGSQSKGSQIAILDSHMQPITGAVLDDQMQEVVSAALHGELAQLAGVQSFRMGRVSVFAAASSVTDWHYVVYTPASQIAGKAASIRNITLGACAVLSIISFLLTWLISMNLYNPIREIVATIQNASAATEGPEAKTDEMSYILSHVKYVTERNRSLDDSLRKVEPVFRDHYLRSLILGIPNRMVSAGASGWALNWPYDHFAVVVAQISLAQEAPPADDSRDSMANGFCAISRTCCTKETGWSVS